ncbi:MAG: MarR family transcriptional regulator [Oscillospiraceae bacterium]|nr:MarR family transcriptional regulator [Oscillospiraceae bacterium]
MMDQQISESLSARLIKAFMKFNRTRWHNAPASGLSQVETDILENIARANRRDNVPRVSDISMMLRVSSPTVTQHLNNLEDQGYVLRTQSKEDKRSVGISLTEKGDGALKSHLVRLEADFNEFIDYIGQDASEEMIKLLMQAHEFFNKMKALRENETM